MAAAATVAPVARCGSRGGLPRVAHGAVKNKQTTQREHDPNELAKMNRDPGVAVGVLGKDHLVIVFCSSGVKKRRNGIENQAPDREPSSEPQCVAS
jgi:hypothetical protein